MALSVWKHWPARLGWIDPLGGLDRDNWLATVRAAAPPAIAVAHPQWVGVTGATRRHFPWTLPLHERLGERSSGRLADLIAATQVPRVVLSGYSPDLDRLALTLHRRHPSIELLAYWHGNLMQAGERTGWLMLKRIVELARERRLARIAFAKVGLAQLAQDLGAPAAFLPCFVPEVPEGPSQPRAGGPHLGIWAVNPAVWRKLPFAMLAASREIPGAVVHLSGATERVIDFAAWLGLDGRFHQRAIPPAEMPARLASMHLNLYVTLSECSPLVPLESLAVGVPCLTGPNAHYFEDEPYLHDRLVVNYPERHEVIAQYARRALEERDEIVAAYRQYAPGYNRRVEELRERFLGLSGTTPPTPQSPGGVIRRVDPGAPGLPLTGSRAAVPRQRTGEDEAGAAS